MSQVRSLIKKYRRLLFSNASIDTTQGSIYKQLLLLAFPIFLSSFFQQSYAFANAWVLGQFAGRMAFAAIQSTMSLVDLVIGFSVGLGVGACVIVSQFFGAHNNKDLNRAAHNALGLALLVGAILSVIGYFIAEPILHLLETPEEIFDEALAFARIYMAGLVFSVFFNTGSALQRSVGDSLTPSLIVAASCAIQVSLDIVFVAIFHMGAEGCAWAGILTLIIASAITLYFLSQTTGAWKISLKKIRLYPDLSREMIRCGLPLALQSSVYSVSNLFVQSSINSFGPATIAGWGLSGRIDAITFLASEALGSATTTFAAQNFGAGNFKRMHRGLKSSLLLTFPLIAPIIIITIAASYPLSLIFTPDTEVARISSLTIHYIGPFYIAYTFLNCIAATVRGSGDSLRPMLLTFFGTCIFRIVWLVTFVPSHHIIEMVLLSYPVTWVTTAILFALYYRFFPWLKIAQKSAPKPVQ